MNTDNFIMSLSKIKWCSPDGNPDPSWLVFDNMDAFNDAAADAIFAIAPEPTEDVMDEHWNVAWRNAFTEIMVRANQSKTGSERRAACGKAEQVTKINTWILPTEVSESAVADAGLYAGALACGLTGSSMEYLENRMNAWRKGYIPLCDVDGILYVYAVI